MIDEPAGEYSPVDFEAITIMFSSPKRENYKNLLKLHNSTTLYMPVWDFDEIEYCRHHLFSNVTAERVRELFLQWGGVPRFVLEKAEEISAQSLLDSALATAKFANMEETVDKFDMSDTFSHRLMHMVVSDDFRLQHITFASPFIAQLIVSGAQSSRRNDILTFVNESKVFGILGPLRGALFEELAHEALVAGGDFEVRALDSQNSEQLTIAQSTSRWFFAKDLSDVGQSSADYCRPAQKNFPVVDSLRRSGQLFQMTVSSQHSVDRKKLQSILEAMDDVETYTFFFVVPDTSFKKKFTKTLAENLPVVDSGRLGKVKYMLLSIPVSRPQAGGIKLLQRPKSCLKFSKGTPSGTPCPKVPLRVVPQGGYPRGAQALRHYNTFIPII